MCARIEPYGNLCNNKFHENIIACHPRESSGKRDDARDEKLDCKKLLPNFPVHSEWTFAAGVRLEALTFYVAELWRAIVDYG